MHLRFIAASLLIAFLTGCATTPDQIRVPDRQTSFNVNENYQSLYRKLLSRARECQQAGLITAQMVVQGDLYTDIKTGVITTALHGGLGVETYQVIDISATDEEHSKVVASFKRGSIDRQRQLIQKWIAGSVDCSY